ncbi:unnamed protein product [Aphis gossypii]|uniref:Uncharacterized protein n=1 Tax=Aphis gossypii TaxID=80765 RepID=A0A9P0NJ01_APHGO|nr:unnamed protein product [Aphis gossypii]
MANCEDCFICNKIAQIGLHNNISKLLEKVQQWDEVDLIMNSNQFKHINKFECLLCFFKTLHFNEWKCHIMSLSHLANSHRNENLYSYVCHNKTCKLLLYGPNESLIKHNIEKHSFKEDVSSISSLMAEVMKRYLTVNLKPLYFCSHCKHFAETPIHTDVKLLNNKIKIPIEYYCRFCRVSFLSSCEMIDYHFLSVEHMTIKCFDELCSETKTNLKQKQILEESKPVKSEVKKRRKKKKSKKKNTEIENVKMSNIQTIKPSITQNVSVSQECDDIKSEYIQNVQLNKSLTSLSVDERIFLDNVPTVQKSLVNNNFLEKSNDDVETSCKKSNENMKLPNHSKHRQKYTNYFKHKINLLKKLRQHEDLILKTLSYYCDVCDFIAVEKCAWDKHNQSEHFVDSYRPITYCSTCSMFVNGNYQEHNRTIEHSMFLNLLQLLTPVEVLKNKTSLIKLVENGSSDKNSINLEQKEKIELNSFDYFEDSKYSTDNNYKNSDCSAMKESSINKDDSIVMENGILLFDESESKYEHERDETNTSNATKLIHSEITTSNNLLNTLIPIPYQANVLLKKIPENLNLGNVLIDDLSSSSNSSSLNQDIEQLKSLMAKLETRVTSLETKKTTKSSSKPEEKETPKVNDEEDDDVDLFGSDSENFENKKFGKLDEDQLYGEYVTQRLKNIKDATIKQHVKLEIDYIFYTKMKQLSHENTKCCEHSV